MAQEIPQYIAPTERLRPSDSGFSAFETAGRRLHINYDQVASSYRRMGDLQAQAIRDRKWPFDILELEARTAREKEQGGGVRFRGLSSRDEDPFGIGKEGTFRDPNMSALNAISEGAGTLGRSIMPSSVGKLVSIDSAGNVSSPNGNNGSGSAGAGNPLSGDTNWYKDLMGVPTTNATPSDYDAVGSYVQPGAFDRLGQQLSDSTSAGMLPDTPEPLDYSPGM